MPRLDKTGPLGKGSKTGRELGRCSEKNSSVTNLSWPGWFSGRRAGRGRGLWNKAFNKKGEETK